MTFSHLKRRDARGKFLADLHNYVTFVWLDLIIINKPGMVTETGLKGGTRSQFFWWISIITFVWLELILTRIWHVPAKHVNRMDARAHSSTLAECAPRFMTARSQGFVGRSSPNVAHV